MVSTIWWALKTIDKDDTDLSIIITFIYEVMLSNYLKKQLHRFNLLDMHYIKFDVHTFQWLKYALIIHIIVH